MGLRAANYSMYVCKWFLSLMRSCHNTQLKTFSLMMFGSSEIIMVSKPCSRTTNSNQHAQTEFPWQRPAGIQIRRVQAPGLHYHRNCVRGNYNTALTHTMASIHSNQDGIFKTSGQTKEEKLVSNFSITIKACR